MKTKMLKPLRVKSGLGNPPKDYTNNANESTNARIKEKANYQRSELHVVCSKMKELVDKPTRTAKNLALFSHQYWCISVPNSTPTSYLRGKTHRWICNHIHTLLSDKYSNICGCCKTNILFHDALESFL